MSREEIQPQKTEPQLELPDKAETQEQERHKLLVPGRKHNLKRIW